MTQPSADEIRVSLQALRAEASIWAEQSEAAKNLSQGIESLSDLHIGFIFALYSGPYREVCSLLTTVVAGGSSAMQAISDTLVASASTYEQEEIENVHIAKGEW